VNSLSGHLTGVAADGGVMECAQALAVLVSSAQVYSVHRSFYEADFVKDEQLGMTMLHGRESGRCCSRLLERERRTDLPALGRTEGSCFYPCRRGTTSIT